MTYKRFFLYETTGEFDFTNSAAHRRPSTECVVQGRSIAINSHMEISANYQLNDIVTLHGNTPTCCAVPFCPHSPETMADLHYFKTQT